MEIRSKISELEMNLKNAAGTIDLFIEDGILTDGTFDKNAYQQIVRLLKDKEENSVTVYYPDGIVLAHLYDVPPAIKQIVFPHSIIGVNNDCREKYFELCDEEDADAARKFKFSSIIKQPLLDLYDAEMLYCEFYETDKPQFPAGEYTIQIESYAARFIECYSIEEDEFDRLRADEEGYKYEKSNDSPTWGMAAFGDQGENAYTSEDSEIKLIYNGRELIFVCDDIYLFFKDGTPVLLLYDLQFLKVPETPNFVRVLTNKHQTLTSSGTFENGFNFSEVVMKYCIGYSGFNVHFSAHGYEEDWSRNIAIEYDDNFEEGGDEDDC